MYKDETKLFTSLLNYKYEIFIISLLYINSFVIFINSKIFIITNINLCWLLYLEPNVSDNVSSINSFL